MVYGGVSLRSWLLLSYETFGQCVGVSYQRYPAMGTYDKSEVRKSYKESASTVMPVYLFA